MPYQLRIGPNVTQSTTAIINDATETNDGVMTKAMVKQLNDNSNKESTCCATDDVIIYLNAATGNDSKDGSTPAKAVKTLSRAYKLQPLTWRGGANGGKMRFIFAPGTYDQAQDIGYPGGNGVALNHYSQLPVYIGAFTNEIGNKTVTVGSTGATVKTAAVIGVDAYYGGFLSFLSGANVGQRRMIVGNDGAGLFSVNAPFDNPTSPGDVFVVERPSVTINMPTFVPFVLAGEVGCGYKGIKFTCGAAFNVAAFLGIALMEGCEIDGQGTGTLLIDSAGIIKGISLPVPFGPNDPTNPFSFLRLPAGVYIHDIFVQLTGQAAMEGYFVFQNALVQLNDSEMNLNQPFSKNVVFQSFISGTYNMVGGASNGPATVNGKLDGNFFGAIMQLDENSYLFGQDLEISNSGMDAVDLFGRSYTKLIRVTGSGNGGYGVAVIQCSQAGVDGGTTVTGAGGDTLVNTVPATYAAIAAGPGVTDGVTLCRIEPI